MIPFRNLSQNLLRLIQVSRLNLILGFRQLLVYFEKALEQRILFQVWWGLR